MRGAATRGRRVGPLPALLAVAVLVFVLVTVLGSGSRGTPESEPAAKRDAFFSLESPHVASSYTTYSLAPWQEHPSAPAARTTTPPQAFVAPIAEYRRYAEGRLTAARADAARLTSALTAGDRPAALDAWRATWSDYLELGAVYLTGSLAALNRAIDGTPGGIPGGVSSPRFTGLHRIEYDLWTGTPSAADARQLQSALARMAARLPHTSLTATEYATRAHEILEDAQRDLLSGADVPWSGEGVLGTAAGLTATERVLKTLHQMLHDEDGEDVPIGGPVEAEVAVLRAVLDRITRAHDGRVPSLAALTRSESEQLQGAVGGALEALSQVPGALESEPPPKPLQIPAKDASP